MADELEMIADYACITGEGPIWHPTERCLYWLDIPRGRLFRYDPDTGQHAMLLEGDPIGGITVQVDGSLLLFGARGCIRVWDKGKLTTLFDELPGEQQTRFNDVCADPEGRVFCGTMHIPERPGRLYRLDPDESIRVVVENVGVSNGIGFTPDLKRMYYTDTTPGEIYLFDYDRATGGISTRRVFVSVPKDPSEGRPDGMTVDADGYVWSARWDGGCLVRYAPDGREDRRIRFPAKKVSCPAFGGPDYSDLYVTCAGGDHKETEGPGAGALFRVRPGVRGRAEFLSKIGL